MIYLDGLIFGSHHVGVDGEGRKHVLGLAEGASENQVVARNWKIWSRAASIPSGYLILPKL